MTEREELAAPGRVSVEPALRHDRIQEYGGRIGGGEHVHGRDSEAAAEAPAEDDHGDDEQHVLPGREDVEPVPADAEVPELGHRRVVQREPHDQRDERDPTEPLSHAQAWNPLARIPAARRS
jgi:hypothetical protein